MKGRFYLIIVILIAAFMRFYQLGVNPPSLTWDEAAWGYNAYSMGKDGHDEFGRFLPYDYLESFGDFKPPMYAYLGVIPVKILGLNEFSTRLPSALFGTLTVLLTYFLTRRLLTDPKEKADSDFKKFNIPIISAAMMTISPWHIMLSRAAFEANIATFFIILGVYLFLVSVQKNSYFLILSVMSFVASIYTFNSARVVAPILLLCLSIGYSKVLIQNKKSLILAIIVGMLLMLPTTRFLLSPQASLRFKEVNIFSDLDVIKKSNQEIANDNNAWWSKVIHNRRAAYGVEIIKHYFDNLSPDFLFIKGDGNPKFSTQDVGQLYVWEFPFLIGGILLIAQRRIFNWWIIPLWLLVGIIPASLARETPHALRIEGSLPTFQILTAYGLFTFLTWLQVQKGIIKKIKMPIFVLLGIVTVLNVVYFMHGYYSHYPVEYSEEWQYGYKESLQYVKDVESKYDNIQIGNSLGRPYIYSLFYNSYDPVKFRQDASVRRDVFGFVHVEGFGKYKFPDNLPNIVKGKKTLFVDNPKLMPSSAHVLKTFYLLNGKPILVAYTL